MLTVKLGLTPEQTQIITAEGVDITGHIGLTRVSVDVRAGGGPTMVYLECFADKVDIERVQAHMDLISTESDECDHVFTYTHSDPIGRCVHCDAEDDRSRIELVDTEPFLLGDDEVERFSIWLEATNGNGADQCFLAGFTPQGKPIWWGDREPSGPPVMRFDTQDKAQSVVNELEGPQPGFTMFIKREAIPRDEVFCRCGGSEDGVVKPAGSAIAYCMACGKGVEHA